MAHTENFIPVKLEGNFDVGQIVKAQLVAIEDKHMISEILV